MATPTVSTFYTRSDEFAIAMPISTTPPPPTSYHNGMDMPLQVEERQTGLDISDTMKESQDRTKTRKRRESNGFSTSLKLTLIGMFILSVILTIEMFVMQISSENSLILMIGAYICSFLSTIVGIALILLWSGIIRKPFEYEVAIMYVANVVVLGEAIIESLAIPTIIYRQATEHFTMLFNALAGHMQFLMIVSMFTTIGVVAAGFVFIALFIYKKNTFVHMNRKKRVKKTVQRVL